MPFRHEDDFISGVFGKTHMVRDKKNANPAFLEVGELGEDFGGLFDIERRGDFVK